MTCALRYVLLWTATAYISLVSSSPLMNHTCEAPFEIGKPIVTSHGLVYGRPAPGKDIVAEYLGIPYAAPPTGNLRFEPPAAYNGSSIINATEYGFACIQATVDTDATEDEDCLTLNIWTKPETEGTRKAIMVWIYGGAYTTGSSRFPTYNGKFIADQGDVMVVSLNYRLNVFGFPGNPDTAPNLGLLDMRAALEWIRNDAAAFGGDASRITLFGQSAGAGMIDFYSYAYASDPIASGFILQSATVDGFPPLSNTSTIPRWQRIAETAGCGSNASDPAAVTACMRSKSVDEIKSSFSTEDTGIGAVPSFGPTADGSLVFDNYTALQAALGGYLIGNNQNEAGLFRLLQPNHTDAYWQDFNDRLYTCADAERIERAIRDGNPAWRYRYFGDFANIAVSTEPPSGAYHGAELQPLFDTVPQSPVPSTTEERAVGDYIRGAWIAFAKNPEEGLLAYADGWPMYSPEEQTLIRIAYENRIGKNLAAGNAYNSRCEDL